MEQLPDTFPSLFIAYTVLWTILALYIVSLGKRLSNLEKSINDTKKN